ncbi:unnamed protein product [Linum trigynum]|uniref:Uncharacterized protein n=1 Tax=Linum trigynum TaxID=586398 RepID=A0AAV2C858_9ROSI
MAGQQYYFFPTDFYYPRPPPPPPTKDAFVGAKPPAAVEKHAAAQPPPPASSQFAVGRDEKYGKAKKKNVVPKLDISFKTTSSKRIATSRTVLRINGN